MASLPNTGEGNSKYSGPYGTGTLTGQELLAVLSHDETGKVLRHTSTMVVEIFKRLDGSHFEARYLSAVCGLFQ